MRTFNQATIAELNQHQAYVWQCGSKWHIRVQTPSGVWTDLANEYNSRNLAVLASIEYGYVLTDGR